MKHDSILELVKPLSDSERYGLLLCVILDSNIEIDRLRILEREQRLSTINLECSRTAFRIKSEFAQMSSRDSLRLPRVIQ